VGLVIIRDEGIIGVGVAVLGVGLDLGGVGVGRLDLSG
jgi:hypothetical protein